MKVFLRILIAVALVVFLISGYQVYKIYSEYKSGADEYQSLSEFVRTESVSETPSVTGQTETLEETGISQDQEMDPGMIPNLHIDVNGLKEKNPDFVGWLYMPTVGISYPIVQGTDDEYYLHHTFERKVNGNGCVFEGYESSKDLTDYNSFLYGHNMKNGAMFGSLKRLKKEEDLLDQDPYFYIYTVDHSFAYRIYSYYVTPPTSDSFYLPQTEEEYITYLDMVTRRSMKKLDVAIDPKKPTVTLSTCSGSGESKQRFLVHGILEEIH